MEYPTITEYQESILYAADCLERLQHLVPVKTIEGRPMMTSGNFAVVFKMQDPTTQQYFALKCFTQDQPNRSKAYKQIADELRYIDAPYFVDMEYYDEEIWVDGYDKALPVVKMDWIDGEPLDLALHTAKDNGHLSLLAYKFSVMASWLINQPFAHGDIKPDNILVRSDNSMMLVDYDGLFVPSMIGQDQRECGTPAFRHPNRPMLPFDELIDDFSLVSINLCLYAIALNPSLLDTHVGKDRLLFSEDDYVNITRSAVINEIHALCADKHLQRLYGLFMIALAEGNLSRCENRLLLLPPPTKQYMLPKVAKHSASLVIEPTNKKRKSKVTSHFCIICGEPVLSNQKKCKNGHPNFSYKS